MISRCLAHDAAKCALLSKTVHQRRRHLPRLPRSRQSGAERRIRVGNVAKKVRSKSAVMHDPQRGLRTFRRRSECLGDSLMYTRTSSLHSRENTFVGTNARTFKESEKKYLDKSTFPRQRKMLLWNVARMRVLKITFGRSDATGLGVSRSKPFFLALRATSLEKLALRLHWNRSKHFIAQILVHPCPRQRSHPS
jgi:hypothetical protein